MNNDLSESQWKQVSGQIKIWWGKIDDDDLERIGGKAERLAGMLQHKYGYTAQHAESQSIRWMRKHQEEPEQTHAASQEPHRMTPAYNKTSP